MDPTSENLYLRARVLVERIANGCKNHNLGSATVSIYDTAWVSMIIRPTVGGDDEVRWLFLESFSFILDSQLPDGGWESYFSIDDGILNTMAAMLAIIRRINALGGLDARQGLLPNLRSRISKAKTYLEKAFQKWDVESSMHVLFEILVPALLTMLENESIYLNFPGRKLLMELNAVKLSGINPEMLYETPTTFLHSLEAFIGTLDFDRVGHHKRFGRMMASPASTAAYLIHSSTWDEEAEGYVRRVIFEGKGKGVGGVPSVFPTTIFEMTWVLSTLIHAGFPIKSLGEENVDKIACCLQEHLQMQQGLLGFCPSVLADAGDTAKAILTLYLLGRTTSLDAMIEHFRSKQGHFQTYLGERDVSFSANCNILKAILGDPGLP
ncbi:hypothetical protein MMC31_002534, partial [Peltigera leucophlebia]|nr:hypothetical protein [Peltigera leucophlebia]